MNKSEPPGMVPRGQVKPKLYLNIVLLILICFGVATVIDKAGVE